MPWLQTHITTPKSGAAFVEALLEGLGALSVTLTDAGDEPQLELLPGEEKLWSETIVTGLFAASVDQQRLVEALQQAAEKRRIPMRVACERLDDQPWERAWMENFRAMRFGRRLWVVPTGQQAPVDDRQAVVMHLDPGLAFGSGSHATTALCLQWLDATPVTGRTVIDYGCGSGILGIAALLLGAADVVAIDHDPQALTASRQNALDNGVSDRLLLLPADAAGGRQGDILVANILASVLVELAPRLAGMVKPGGEIALSGILNDQAEMVQHAYAEDFSLEQPRQLEGWLLITGRRR
jgi:ribosomal protein L11 methyltransferase